MTKFITNLEIQGSKTKFNFGTYLRFQCIFGDNDQRTHWQVGYTNDMIVIMDTNWDTIGIMDIILDTIGIMDTKLDTFGIVDTNVFREF